MITVDEMSRYIKKYSGRPLTFMEVCGSHTAAIAKYGIKSLLSDRIRLVSGPGCPVCVTPSSYIDRLIELAGKPDTCVATFGDLLRVPGSTQSLSEAKGMGAKTAMVYSPMNLLGMAKEHPDITYVFAAVGFETTAPVYTLLIEEAQKEKIGNIRLLTSLKTMPAVIGWLLEQGTKLDGFLAPGHVCAVTGSSYFDELAFRYQMPFAVSGFKDTELVTAIYGLVRMAEKKECLVKNFYPSVVEQGGNTVALEKMRQYFEPCSAVWRGMGCIENSGLLLNEKYQSFDAGSKGLDEDKKRNDGCRCGEILTGRLEPRECPLFGTVCHPGEPQGACMVSYEGSCYQNFVNAVGV